MVEADFLAFTALLFGALSIYAQLEIPTFAPTERTTIATRGMLAATGIALGAISASLFRGDPGHALLAFVSGFGVVHFPAAVILALKRARGSGFP